MLCRPCHVSVTLPGVAAPRLGACDQHAEPRYNPHHGNGDTPLNGKLLSPRPGPRQPRPFWSIIHNLALS